jgi:hypothetical protein
MFCSRPQFLEIWVLIGEQKRWSKRSELEVVKEEIAEVKAKLTKAERAGWSIDYLTSLNNYLTELLESALGTSLCWCLNL